MVQLLMEKPYATKTCIRCGSTNDLVRVIVKVKQDLNGNPPMYETGHTCPTCRHYVEHERDSRREDQS
jgi:ssDNA-binding Zn-finger/Zn-ribbon topoisomerase 1